ncbi:MAG: DUF805 domain-containing protein [Betaproteobacteria bacterium]|nr:DUF805 domain-containing protein [Betaproteobacteria bacterium]
MSWYLMVLRKYADFAGRARRKEYWMFVLVNVIAMFIAAMLDSILGTRNVLQALYWLALLVPSIAVGVRRLHDTDRTGWWLLLAFVPIIGVIVLLVFMVQAGQTTDNRFGPNPKIEAA